MAPVIGVISMEAGSITFSTALDNKQLEKELSSLARKIEKKERDIVDLTAKRDHARQKSLFDAALLDQEKAKLQEIKDRLADIRAMSKDKSLPIERREALKEQLPVVEEELADQRTRVQMLQSEWDKLENQIDRYGQKIEDATEAVARQKEEAGELQQQISTMQASAQNGSAARAESQKQLNAYLEKSSSLYQKLNGMIGKTTEMSGVLQGIAATTGGKLSAAFQTAGEAVGGLGAAFSGVLTKMAPLLAIATAAMFVFKKLWTAAKNFASGFTDAMKRGASAVYSFGSAVAKNFVTALKDIGRFGSVAIKMVSGVAKKSVELANKFNVFSKLTDTLNGKFKRLGNTIKSALVFSVIYKGLSLVREQVGKYLSVNTQFMTSLRRLQGVLLTAFQPVYEIVIPALTTLINVLSRAIATVTQFFAALFGKSAKQAQVNAKSLYEQASATEAAGAAAEEASKQLASFDEINKLEGNKSAGGGGGSAGAETGPLFDFEYEDTPFDSWGEAFSGFLDKLLAGIPKLEDIFKDFADWLNDLARKLYDMFTFPGVLDKVKQLGRELADALNKLVDWIDWYQLGQALGAGLNLALNFLTSFLYKFDWVNLGRKLAALVNGLVHEIDWYEFGRLLWAGFKVGLETLAGFLLGLDMPQLAEAASNIILGLFNEMEKTIRRIPWVNLGRQIAALLNNIQWYDIITSIADTIYAGIIALYKLVHGFVGKLDWDGIAEQIYTAVNDSIGNESLFQKLGEILSSLFIHAFDFCRTVIAGIEWKQIGRDIAAFILGFDWGGAFGALADLIAEGIHSAIRLAQGFLDRIVPEIQNIARDLAERLKMAVQAVHWGELGRVIGDGIKAALSFVAGLLDPELFYEVGKAIGDFLINLDWPGIIGGLAEALANGINSAVAAVKGFLESVKPNLKQIAEDIAGKINQFIEEVDWKELGSVINDGINTALDFLLDILDQLDWDNIGNTIVDFFTALDWGGLMKKWGTVVGRAMGDAIKAIDLGDLLWLGAQIVDGWRQGMMNRWDESGGVLGWITRLLFKPFIDGFKTLFGISSPSTVMIEQGGFITEGLLKGISDTWHTITDFFSGKIEMLKTFFSDAWENIKKTASEKWGEIKKTLGDAWEEIKKSAKEKFDEVRKKVSDAWENIKKDVPQKWESIKTTLKTAWDGVRSAAEEKFGEIKDKIIGKMEEVENKDWYQTGKSIVDGILSGLESIWNSLTSWARNVKDTISNALSGASSRGGGFGSTSRSGGFGGSSRIALQAVPDISAFNIPALAKGAVIPPNREFLAVLGDQKSGTNIEAPTSEIENAVIRAMQKIGVMGGNQTVVLQVDGRELGRATVKFGGAEYQRIGTRLVEAHT